MTTSNDWRGVAAENRDDEIPDKVSLVLKERSRRLLGDLLRPHKKILIWLTVAVLIENAARLSVPWLVKEGIDRGIPPILDGEGSSTLMTIIAMLLVAVLVQAVTRQFFLMLAGRIGQNVLLSLRRRVYSHFQKLSPAFHEDYTSGRVISRQTSDVDAIYELLETGFDGLITAVLTLFGTAVLLLLLDLKLGLVALLCFPLLYLLTRWFRTESAKAYRRTRETVAVVIVHFVETMNGMRAVQAFRRERRNQDIFESVDDDYRRANERAFRLVGLFMPGIKLIGNVTIAVVLVYGAHLVVNGEILVGVLAAFLLYLRQFFEPMQEISQFYNTFQSASAALEKLSGVLEEDPSLPEPTAPIPMPEAHGALHFEHVSFSYVEDRAVLPDLEVEVPAGMTLALVGTTGAGKTTLAKLVARFYDPIA
ncbi:MAG: ATP-binding cassette domain-containing protein, partial [Nocardioidaceae bacterium]|nr:ATP-binding cassette domain-containing protein [Nocardioidaceae bacterium]